MGLLGAAFVHAVSSLVQLVRQLRASLQPMPLHSSSATGGGGGGGGESGSGRRTVAHAADAIPAVETEASAAAKPTLSYTERWSCEAAGRDAKGGGGGGTGSGGGGGTGSGGTGSGGGGGSGNGSGGGGGGSGGGSGAVDACGGGCSRLARLSITAECLFAALLSRYGYTLVVAFTSAMLTFPFGFFGSSPEDVINEVPATDYH